MEGMEIFLGETLTTRFVSKEANMRAFTGTFYALYTTGNGKSSSSEARHTKFLYQGRIDRRGVILYFFTYISPA